jgi:hypothetical protein
MLRRRSRGGGSSPAGTAALRAADLNLNLRNHGNRRRENEPMKPIDWYYHRNS